MALVKGGIAGEMSGKVGGMVFARNRSGMYVRSHATPVNPDTDRQQAARSKLSSLAQAFFGILTPVQRTAWNQYGSQINFQNRLGDDIFLSGINHYIRTNSAVLLAGGVRIDDAPVINNLGETDPTATAVIDETGQLLTVSFDDTMPWLDEDNAFLIVGMSQPKDPSKSFIGGPFRYAGSIEGDSVTPPTTPDTIAVPYVVVESQKVQMYFRIARADGRLTGKFFRTVAVVA